MRTNFSPNELSSRDFYRLLTAVVVPRPIAWVSSTSPQGVDNLAPHSFFTVASIKPPIVQFTSVGEKDTMRNITSTREFVVNLASANLLAEVNASGTDFAPDISEFDEIGLTREASATVTVPRVAASPVSLECRLLRTLPMGDCFLIFGEVVHAVVTSAVLRGTHPDIGLLEPLSRLGLDEWGSTSSVRELRRIRKADWPGHFNRKDDPSN